MVERLPARHHGGTPGARPRAIGLIDKRTPGAAALGSEVTSAIDLVAPPEARDVAPGDVADLRDPHGGLIDLRTAAPTRRPEGFAQTDGGTDGGAATRLRPDPFRVSDDNDTDHEGDHRSALARRAHRQPASPGLDLRRALVVCDVVITMIVWLQVITFARDAVFGGGFVFVPLQAALASAITLVALRQLGLYKARVCIDRRVARRRMLLASLVAPGIFAGVRSLAQLDVSPGLVITSVAVPWLGLVVVREVYEQWLRAARTHGRFVRPIIVAGAADEVRQITHLLDAHPETGFVAVGWIGEAPEDGYDVVTAEGVARIGGSTELLRAARLAGATGVLAGPSAAAWPRFPKVATELQQHGLHVQLWSGLWGVAARRLRPMPLAHEPFFYLEQPGSLTRRRWLKRTLDVVLASVILALTSPILAVAAIAIRRHDGGPAFFRQKRVGLHGELFELRKLRTMTEDAEIRLADLQADNERSGPLFKLTVDPRVTPVGKLLRATSIDELPQLLDVLAGRLSLVGPRPALPSEVAEFDDALLDRHGVLPGITGLWQAEARHNPSFDAYRHLDLFYVENWTVVLDLLILLATARTVMTDTARAASSFIGRRSRSGRGRA
jgi:exopolysaccharide biosynthesis polyprenyl glycosylphosphotransferase